MVNMMSNLMPTFFWRENNEETHPNTNWFKHIFCAFCSCKVYCLSSPKALQKQNTMEVIQVIIFPNSHLSIFRKLRLNIKTPHNRSEQIACIVP